MVNPIAFYVSLQDVNLCKVLRIMPGLTNSHDMLILIFKFPDDKKGGESQLRMAVFIFVMAK